MRRVDQSKNRCPIARSLNIFGDGWSLLIVRDALFGKTRFGEFEASLGMAKNILAARLKTLVEAGILEVVPATDGGAHHSYVLTPKGQELRPVLKAIRTWGDANCPLGAERR